MKTAREAANGRRRRSDRGRETEAGGPARRRVPDASGVGGIGWSRARAADRHGADAPAPAAAARTGPPGRGPRSADGGGHPDSAAEAERSHGPTARRRCKGPAPM